MKARTKLVALAIVSSLPLLAGCMVDPPAAPEQPAMEEVAFDTAEPLQLAAGVVQGRPERLHPGTGMSYWVWANHQNEWHLRATTARQAHRFQGRIRALNGATLKSLKPTRAEWNDRVRSAGSDIVFDFVVQGGEDGLDFNLNGNGCVDMDLRIDGKPHPTLTILGKTEHVPERAHFIACP